MYYNVYSYKAFRDFFLLCLIFYSNHSYPYPQFIAHGYTTCLVCHYNPAGNGPLTDYGRAVAATAISGKDFYFSEKNEEDLSKSSGFLGSSKLPYGIKPSLDIRGLYYTKDFREDDEESVKIPMQLEAQVVKVFKEDNSLFLTFSLGYAPDPRYPNPNNKDLDSNMISREHYLGHRPSPKFGYYVGFMDIAFGIRQADHILYSRKDTNLSYQDQTHGIMLNFLSEKIEFNTHFFFGNLYQTDEKLRERGVSLNTELQLSSKWRPGFSFLYASNNYVTRLMLALHSRYGNGTDIGLLNEIGFILETPVTTTRDQSMSFYHMLQSFYKIRRGLYLLTTFEFTRPDIETNRTTFLKWGPGIVYFPIQRVELRTELKDTRSLNSTQVSKDEFEILTQLHLWF